MSSNKIGISTEEQEARRAKNCTPNRENAEKPDKEHAHVGEPAWVLILFHFLLQFLHSPFPTSPFPPNKPKDFKTL